MGKFNVDIALLHYPVANKNGETVGSAITNLDIHDIARAGRTYGVGGYYIVNPYEDQLLMAAEIIDHWQKGHGAGYNPKRKEALSIVKLCSDFETLLETTAAGSGKKPVVLATSAREDGRGEWSYEFTRRRISDGEHILLLFGTGWGITREILDQADGLLPPISGYVDYNHLSVRSAVAVVLDRLMGRR